MSEWYEDDAFWSSWYPYVFSDERFGQAEHEVDQIPAFATPTALIDGEVVFGFEKRKLLELLGI